MLVLHSRLRIVSFRPKSVKTTTSSWEAPKAMYETFAVSDVGSFMVAQY